MKLTRLALHNVRKSYKDYMIYFLTLMFSICLFYTFNSFQAQKEIMSLNDSQSIMLQTLGIFMGILSVFVAIVLAFLVMYANNFLIKRRKKEFGLYMLLGMEKKDISKVLIYETVCIGVVSLGVGLLLGILCSQGLGIFTAHLFSVQVNYNFVFSPSAAIITAISFTIIFLVIMLLNTRVIAKVKLIELLQAERKQEKARIQKPFIAVLIFIVSLLLLGAAYYLATRSTQMFASCLVPILIMGSLGTLFFFLSLSGFLLQFIRSSKRLYYRGLRMFVLRQVNAKINTSFVSMSIVCLMLLLSVGALSVGWNLNDSLKTSLDTQTPYAYSFTQYQKADTQKMRQILMLDTDKNITSSETISVYTDHLKLKDLFNYAKDVDTGMLYKDADLEIITLSDFNKARRAWKLSPMQLKQDETFFISGSSSIIPSLNEIAEQTKKPLQVFNHKLHLQVKQEEAINIATEFGFSTGAAIVVPDAILPPQIASHHTFWNIDVKDESKIEAYDTKVHENAKKLLGTNEQTLRYSSMTRKLIIDNQAGLGMLFTYVGLYLGVVFLVASAAVLALQQLSEAEDNQKRYLILRKIGTSEKMMNHSIYAQISIYFLLPLVLAVIHASVGIPVVSTSLMSGLGIGDIGLANFFCAIVVILIYGSYYVFTCMSYKQTLYARK